MRSLSLNDSAKIILMQGTNNVYETYILIAKVSLFPSLFSASVLFMCLPNNIWALEGLEKSEMAERKGT